MKALSRCTIRLFKNQLSRFFSLLIIVIVSIGFMAGIGEVDPVISVAVNDYYQSQNVADLYLKSGSPSGFLAQDVQWLKDKFGEENVLTSFSYEYLEEGQVVRVYSHDLSSPVNKLELIDGRLPQNSQEILAERETEGIKAHKIGDVVSISGADYTVCGIVANPLLVYQNEDMSFQYEDKHLCKVFYLPSPAPLINDVYVSLADRALFDSFSDDYKQEIHSLKEEISQNVSADVTVLSLYENLGLYVLSAYGEKVGDIAIIFVVFFLLITLLVVYSTMSRLFDEERNQIACMKTLGHSQGKIVGRYVLFVFLASLLGGLLAFGVGQALTSIIYNAFNLQYRMPAFPKTSYHPFFLVSFIIILVSNTLLTLFAGLKLSSGKPTALLAPKMAKSGKKVFLEKIPAVWNKLSFRYKSTLRNVLLFKGRFFMTVLSVIGSTVLVFAGLGLLDCASTTEGGSSLISISIALLVFSAALCALVVYNLTNINVGERKREIATLMVLGYNDKEVSGYIFREIYIMGVIGALFGLIFGYFFVDFVFNLIDFGSVADINWWSYVITPVITMFFCFLATLLLKKKIVKTDMNASLKSIE
ncbi:MAG: ABC transporter permease [Clostridia bacterium]|nr:ABC transporter permease [Clostridia bacterium]